MTVTILPLFALLPAWAVEVKLIDSRTGAPVPNAAVQVLSDNGIRCIKAPCPTNFQQWTGRSDASGGVSVPGTVFNSDTRFSVEAYEETSPVPKEAAAASSWTLELDRKDTASEGGMRIDRIKLIDRPTRKPLANVSYWISTSRGCASSTCASAVITGRTNVLGNAFVPLVRIPDLEKNLWIGADGHKAVPFQSSQDLAVSLPR